MVLLSNEYLIFIDDYNSFTQSRCMGSRGVGVAMMVHTRLKAKRFSLDLEGPKTSSFESLVANISLPNMQDIIVLIIYRPQVRT